MTPEFIMTLGNRAMMVTLELSAPILIISMIVGLAISIFQAVTQIQEMTLTFVPKILVSIAVLVVFGPWMLTVLMDFTTSLITNIPQYIRQ